MANSLWCVGTLIEAVNIHFFFRKLNALPDDVHRFGIVTVPERQRSRIPCIKKAHAFTHTHQQALINSKERERINTEQIYEGNHASSKFPSRPKLNQCNYSFHFLNGTMIHFSCTVLCSVFEFKFLSARVGYLYFTRWVVLKKTKECI